MCDSDRRSPVPPVSQGTDPVEPTREYDIIDDEAVATTVPGTTSGPGIASSVSGRLGLPRIGHVAGPPFHADTDKITDANGENITESGHIRRLNERQSNFETDFERHQGQGQAESEHGEFPSLEFDQHRDHSNGNANEVDFAAMVQGPEADIPQLNLPRVNCPEKIIICIDLATEVNRLPFLTKEGAKQLPLEMVKKALTMFVQIKSAIDPNHEFALVLLQESALWIQDFTNDIDDFVNVLLDMTNDTTECESCNLKSLFDVIHEKVQIPEIEDIECLPPPYIIRTLFLYGRSLCVPVLAENGGHQLESQKILCASPYFFFDVFYLHEPPTEENFCKAIYDVFLNLDVHNTSFIHEVGRDIHKLHEKMAMLIAHPLQRPSQLQCEYDIFKD